MNIKIVISLFFSMFFLFGEATAYFNETTHPEISGKAVSIYQLNTNTSMFKFGSIEEDLPGQNETVAYGIPIKQWRSYNHFFDPYTGLGYHDITGNWRNARDFALSSEVQKIWLKSIGRENDSRDFFKIYSYDEAKRLYLAGDATSAYRTLGHVAHLLQDMGSPPHVWNDAHVLNYWFISNPLVAGIPLGVEYEYEYYVSNIYRSSVNLSKGNIIKTNDLGNLFYNFAVETRTNFFSEDHIEVTEAWKKEHNAKISIIDSKKYVTGSLIGDHIPANYAGKNDFKFARVGLFSRWAPNNNSILHYILDDEVHMNYWDVLSYKATLYTASLIDFFQKEVAPPPPPPSSLPGFIFFPYPSVGNLWASPLNTMGVGCLNGTSIYFTMVNTYDGSTPTDPREPTSSDNDGSAYGVFSYVDGSGVTGKVLGYVDLYASVGQLKMGKLRFRCYNSAGIGIDTPTEAWPYTINLRDLPGEISVNPSSGNWTTTPQNIVVSSSFATTIYYTMVNTYDGNTPEDPREPTSSDNDGSIYVPGGMLTFQGNFGLYATDGQYKRSKLRFKAYNTVGAGPASQVYSYSINRRIPDSFYINNTSGTWYNISSLFSGVSIRYADRIYCTVRTTIDGSTPSDPPPPTPSSHDYCVIHTDRINGTGLSSNGEYITSSTGPFELFGEAGLYKRIKMRFGGYNDYGSLISGVYSYTIDNR